MQSRDPSADRVALESKIAFLEHTIDALNEVVLAQGRSLDLLEAKLLRLEGRLAADGPGTDDAGGGDLEDHRPPHY